MSKPVSSRTKGPQAISRQKLQVAVGLLAGHTTLRAHMFKLGLTQSQDCRLCGDEMKTVYILYIIVRFWHAKDTEPWVVFLTLKGLENIRMNGLIKLVANTRLSILKYRGDAMDL